MKNLLKIVFSGLSLSAAVACPNKIVIIRHAEKPPTGGNLNELGLARSLALSSVLEKFGDFKHIYVPTVKQVGTSTEHMRPLQTITPFAITHNLEINTKYKRNKVAKLATVAKKQNGDVLIIWTCTRIPKLAQALGVANPPNWEETDYDSVWIITYPRGLDKAAKLQIEQENIKPSVAKLRIY